MSVTISLVLGVLQFFFFNLLQTIFECSVHLRSSLLLKHARMESVTHNSWGFFTYVGLLDFLETLPDFRIVLSVVMRHISICKAAWAHSETEMLPSVVTIFTLTKFSKITEIWLLIKDAILTGSNLSDWCNFTAKVVTSVVLIRRRILWLAHDNLRRLRFCTIGYYLCQSGLISLVRFSSSAS